MGSGEPGDLVAGRYRLRSVLGRGGMGVVWLASDELLHRDVAVKEILWPPQLDVAEQQLLRQRALREARTAARLNHPNLAGVYDVVEVDGRPWIVMQLVPYRSLSEVVRENGPLPPRRAAQVGLRVLEAIEAAHAVGVLHRDVKPGNVLLGPGDRVVLTDFGMAIADASPTLTTSGVLIGSPSYMAPERARGERATPATDLWSLGATLYAAVEGRPPFGRDGAMAVLTAIVTDDPDAPSRAGSLWPVISGLLRKNPDERLDAAGATHLLRRAVESHGVVPDVSEEESTSPLDGDGQPPEGPVRTDQHSAPLRMAATTLPQQVAVKDGRGLEPALIPGLEPHWHVPGGQPPAPEPAPGGFPRRRRPRLRWIFGIFGGVAAAVALVAAIGVLAGGSPGHRIGSPGATKASTAGAAKQPSTGTTAPSSPASAPPGSSSGSGSGALPAGSFWYHDRTGFSIGVPTGWHVSHVGHLVYVQDQGSGRFLIIDQSRHPKPDPLADWRQQEASRISTYPGYHRIRLQAVHYAQAERAADWEFTYYQNGQLIHVLNRNILASPDRAYALYWSTPASEWGASYHFFQTFAATFRPAYAVTGS
jgi:eukaryotic-like serine/threonine-protein kinase